MIKLLRVDHRLLHGQVAFSWTSKLGADCILVANDDVMQDEMRKTAIKFAKPANIKLVMKTIDGAIESINSGVTDKYKLLVVVESIEDAYKLIKNTSAFTSLNLGGTKPKENTRSISKVVSVNEEETNLLKELIKDNIEVEIRMVPEDTKILATKVL